MAPEQARGEIAQIDEQADVFALGSILCEVLTGQPAFVGRSAGEIHRKAALGDLAEAVAALESSGADGELIALARDCLEREAEDRPRHAGAVAERITAYLSGVQEKLRSTEIARAAEQARAEESRRTAEVAQSKAKAERRARRLTGCAGGGSAGDDRGRRWRICLVPAATGPAAGACGPGAARGGSVSRRGEAGRRRSGALGEGG
jgi:serine/threonine-protein kinase